MKAIALPPLILPASLPALAAADQSALSKCVELNFRAAALQTSDSCQLLNTVINQGIILAADASDIDATCGVHLEGVDRPNCVEEVVEVASGIIEQGCDITGGATVANFVSTVNNNREGFAPLLQLACKRQGECYVDVQNAVEYCGQNAGDDECMNLVTCECLVELLNVVEGLSDRGGEAFLPFDDALKEKIEVAGSTCRCEDIDARALALEVGPSCALPWKIVQEKDLFAGDTDSMVDTCNAGYASCVDEMIPVVDEFIEHACPVRQSTGEFIYSLYYGASDFRTLGEFACTNFCYGALRTCQEASNCGDALPCKCLSDFMTLHQGLSADTKEDLLQIDTAAMEGMERALGRCNCAEWNANAARFQNEDICSLHAAIVEEGSIFAGNATDVQSTCSRPYECGAIVTAAVARITEGGCDIKMDSDGSAKFLYNVNDNGDWVGITNFVCADDDCYDAIKGAVESGEPYYDCAAVGQCECVESFLEMAEGISHNNLLGIKSATLEIIFADKTTAPTPAPASGGRTPLQTPRMLLLSMVVLFL